MNFAAGNVRQLGIEQGSECPQDATLRLTTQSQQNEIVARQDCVYDLGHNRIFVSDNAGKHLLPRAQPDDQVVAQLVFDAPREDTLFGKLRMTTKLQKT